MTPADPKAAEPAPREVEDLRPGEHACHVYESRVEASALAVRLLLVATQRGAQALWLHPADVNPVPALAAGGPLVALALDSGAIEALSVETLPLGLHGPDPAQPPGPESALGQAGPCPAAVELQRRLAAAAARGRTEVCVVVDASEAARAADGGRRLLALEADLEPAGSAHLTLLCQLDRASVPAAPLLALVRAHSLVAHAGRVLRNPEAAPPATLLAGDPPARALDGLLARLHERETAEKALRESERLFRLLTENARDAVFRRRVGPPAAFEYVSPALLELTGYTPEEHYRDPSLLDRTVHPDDRELLADLPGRANGEPLVIRFFHRDGRLVHTETRNVLIRDAEGTPVAVEGIVRDVTAWARDEAALRASEARLRSTIASMDEGILFFDADQCVVDCNASAERILELSRREILGRTRPPDRQVLRDDGTPFPADEHPVNRTFRTGEPSRALAGLVRRDGSVRWVSVGVEPLPLGPDGRLGGAVASLTDTTAERRAWVEVRRREAQLRLAMECAGHEFWELEVTRDPQLSLGAGRVITSLDPTRADPATWLARVHPDDRRQAEDDLQAHVEGRTPSYVSEFRVPTEGGGWKWMLARGRAVARGADGRALRLAGTVTDVTEVKALQDRLRHADRLAGVGTLAAGIAHEVNNPLAYVAANLAVVEETLASVSSEPGLPFKAAARLEELRKAVNEARDGARRVGGIVQGLRQFSAPSHDQRRAPVDVRAEIEAAVGIARNEIAHRARLTVDLAPGLPPVSAAPHELGQVFVNLLVNAAQAVREGRAAEEEVRIVARAEGTSVLVEVSDTGSGIDPAHLPRLFDPFFTTKAVGAGSGLGLSVCHGIVTSLGGTIDVHSTPERGSTFRVRLPACMQTAAPTPPARDGPATPRRGRVLVVDDEPLVARSLSRLLSSAHEVTVVTSPLEVLRRATAGERWDVVLCDLMMPELSGMELEARIAAAAPDLVARMTYLTGGAFTERSQAFLAEGRPWLEKPVDPAALRAHVALRVASVTGRAAKEVGASRP